MEKRQAQSDAFKSGVGSNRSSNKQVAVVPIQLIRSIQEKLDHLTRAVKLLEFSEVPNNIALQGDQLYRKSGDDREDAV